MQTDVKYARLTQSGWIVQGPGRVKGVGLRNASTGVGRVYLFDTNATPSNATYGQNNTTVTITSTAHGLTNGATVSIGYGLDTANTAATCGTYTVTSLANANAFTVTDFNSTNVIAGTACYYVSGDNRWMWVRGLANGDIYNNFELFPGEGIQAKQKVYIVVSNILSSSVFYG